MSQNNAWIEKSLQWVIAHRQTLGAAAGTAGVATLIFSLVFYQKHKVQEQDWNTLSMAENQIMRGQPARGVTMLNELVQHSHSAPVLVQAYQLLGSLSLVAGNAQQSVQMYQEGVKNASSNPDTKALLLMGLGTAHEQAGDFRKAEEVYGQFLSEFPEHYLTSRILMSAIRVEMINNNPNAAREHYERLLTAYPDTPWAKRAGSYLDSKSPASKAKLP